MLPLLDGALSSFLLRAAKQVLSETAELDSMCFAAHDAPDAQHGKTEDPPAFSRSLEPLVSDAQTVTESRNEVDPNHTARASTSASAPGAFALDADFFAPSELDPPSSGGDNSGRGSTTASTLASNSMDRILARELAILQHDRLRVVVEYYSGLAIPDEICKVLELFPPVNSFCRYASSMTNVDSWCVLLTMFLKLMKPLLTARNSRYAMHIVKLLTNHRRK